MNSAPSPHRLPLLLSLVVAATASVNGAHALSCTITSLSPVMPTSHRSSWTSSPIQSPFTNQNQSHYLSRQCGSNYGYRTALSLPRGGSITRRFSSSNNNNNNNNAGNDHVSNAIIQQDQQEEEATIVHQQKRKLTLEFFTIAIPAFVQLAAEPLAGLVDTAYLGRLGPEVLGGAGVAISAQYAVSKLYNDPLLRTSISLVASEDGKNKNNDNTDNNNNTANNKTAAQSLSIAVSSALLLAFTVGAIQLLLYYTFASTIIRGMGVPQTSPMHHSAYSYLRIRALGTPAATLWLVTNGIFRGLGDTRTPLKYSLLFTGLNAILDPLFIFTLGYGASGAAAGTALAQYVALVPLMWSLHRKVGVDVLGQWRELGGTLKEYVTAGGFVLARTVGKVLAYSVCARQAALLGSVAAAAYNLTFQLGFATTQICESVAVAVQTLLAREIAGADKNNAVTTTTTTPHGRREANRRAKRIRHLINGSILAGGLVAGSLSLVTFLQKESVLRSLTTDIGIREASRVIFPAVLVTQVLKGLAYPVNGIIMGGLDWKFTMAAMWLANFVCVGMIQFWAKNNCVTLGKIWWALAAFMGTQVVTGAIRFQSQTGVWRLLKGSGSGKDTQDENDGIAAASA